MVACQALGSRLRAISEGVTETEITIPFLIGDWEGKALSVIRSGIPVAGQIGPHLLPIGSYSVNVYKNLNGTWIREVKTIFMVNYGTGEILLRLQGTATPFSGRVVINYARLNS